MKKLLIFLLIPLLAISQPSVTMVGAGEYNCFLLDGNKHQIYDASAGVPQLVAGQPAIVTAVWGCLHHQVLLDNVGNAYAWGDNAYGECGNGLINTTQAVAQPTKIATDSSGKPFTNIIQAVPAAGAQGYYTLFLKGDGTVWIVGAAGLGARGNHISGGNVTR